MTAPAVIPFTLVWLVTMLRDALATAPQAMAETEDLMAPGATDDWSPVRSAAVGLQQADGCSASPAVRPS